MDKITDIRPLKNSLRRECKAARASMDVSLKATYDKKICNKLLNMWAVRDASAVLTYVSTQIEVDTRVFIETLLSCGKTVAVPRCGEQVGQMSFYRIESLSDLEDGAFGVLEPKENCPEFFGDENSACVVPAFSFDEYGYRLGYGKGYYDRFLSSYTGKKIGICYDAEIRNTLYHGKYDRTVDLIITPKKLITVTEKTDKLTF